MDLHHKLRRDPSWPANGCNICGQVGHQAANCPNGTINWRQIYGDDAFILRAPMYTADYEALKKRKDINYSEIEKRAREYAKMRTEAQGFNYDEMTKRAQQMFGQAVPAAAAAPAAAPAPAAEEPLPDGWSIAHDQSGRPYYWHTKTKKVQWDRPMADTPIQ